MITWIKQIFRLTRYFLVIYTYILENGNVGQGQAAMTVNDGKFPSIKYLGDNLDFEINTVFFTNVMELNKRDHHEHVARANEMKGKEND